jgi:hypothetical protein
MGDPVTLSFRRDAAIAGGWRYATPAGWYTLTGVEGAWVVATPGGPVGTYPTVPEAESALDAHVKERMWY